MVYHIYFFFSLFLFPTPLFTAEGKPKKTQRGSTILFLLLQFWNHYLFKDYNTFKGSCTLFIKNKMCSRFFYLEYLVRREYKDVFYDAQLSKILVGYLDVTKILSLYVFYLNSPSAFVPFNKPTQNSIIFSSVPGDSNKTVFEKIRQKKYRRLYHFLLQNCFKSFLSTRL